MKNRVLFRTLVWFVPLALAAWSACGAPHQQAYVKASNTEGFDWFGDSVAVSGDTVVIGASSEDSNATGINGNQSDNSKTNSGAAYIVIRRGTNWEQQAYLKAARPRMFGGHGGAVALEGDTVVIGGPGGDGGGMGEAFIFGRTGNEWKQQANLGLVYGMHEYGFTVYDHRKMNSPIWSTPPVHGFGRSVGLSGDTVVVGGGGAVCIFVRRGTDWVLQACLKAPYQAPNRDENDTFGSAVAVSGDTLVVGDYFEGSSAVGVNGNQADEGAPSAGAAYVFARRGTNWNIQAYLKASNTDRSDWFGWSVAVSGDTVVIGASGEDSNATGINGDQSNKSAVGSGAAYVFVRRGTNWNQQAYVKPSHSSGFSPNKRLGDSFGCSVAVSDNTLVVGARNESSKATGVNGHAMDDSRTHSGAAYIFVRRGTNWSQQAYLKASNTGASDSFGFSVAVSGETVVIGAPGEASNATGVNGNQGDNSASFSGAAYVFTSFGTRRPSGSP